MNDKSFPFDVETTAASNELKPSPQALALLRELQDMLRALMEHNEPNSIDVRSLPLAPGDYAFLCDFLGEGEVSANINTLGLSEIKETRFSGVWWLKHLNTEGEIVAELIEVTLLPDILKTQTPDIVQSLDNLKIYIEKQHTLL